MEVDATQPTFSFFEGEQRVTFDRNTRIKLRTYVDNEARMRRLEGTY